MRRRPQEASAPALTTLLAPTLAEASAAQRLLWRCARVGRSDETLAEIQRLGALLDADGWAWVAAQAERDGVENLLFEQIAAANLLPALPEAVTLRLRERYGAVTLLARRLERRLVALLARLAAAGVSVIPLKGVSLARRYYGGAVTLRPVTDIDLLVREEEEPFWSAVFREEGFAPLAGRGELKSGHALRFHEAQFRSADGLLLEAHSSLCPLPPYRRALPLDAVWRRAQVAQVNSVPMLTLALEDEARFLSLHYAAQHQASRLIWLVDVAELLRAHGADLDWERLVRDAVAGGFAAPLAVTLLRATTLLDAPAPSWACERLREAALTEPELRAWSAAHAPMDDWRRFLAQTLALDAASARLRLLRSGIDSLSRRLRAR